MRRCVVSCLVCRNQQRRRGGPSRKAALNQSNELVQIYHCCCPVELMWKHAVEFSGTLSHGSGLGWASGRMLDEGSFHLKSENKLGAWKRPKKMESPLDWTGEKDGKEGQAVTCAFTGETRESMGEIKTEPLTSLTSHLDQHSQSLLYRPSSSSIPPPTLPS